MTAFPAAAMRPHRFPVQQDLDADFTLADLARIRADPGPIPRSQHRGFDVAAYEQQVWQLDRPIDDGRLLDWEGPASTTATIGEPSASDLALLHAFEVCGLWHPPVAHNLDGLSAPRACVWLAVADRWILLSHTSADLRLLNAACKLIGAVWTRWHTAAGDGWPSLARSLAHTARLLSDATHHLTGRLNHHPPPTATATTAPFWQTPPTLPGEAPSIVVLAGAGSAGAQQFLSDLPHPSPVDAVCWYDAPSNAIPASSAYASAWYPPEPAASGPPGRPGVRRSDLRHHTARTWDDVTGIIRSHRTDLLVLIGMPIVPTPVLRQARLGVINAHNGALPQYRGMDAVGWAVLNNDPIICTLHLAAPAVDQGDILATAPVPYEPPASLRRRVKATQLDLLLAVTLHAAATGRLPEGSPQGPGRQYYRLHPHLKRVLDTRKGNPAGRK
ncbi:formyl transferase-like protein [Micromonospora sp. Llam0]|uniref:formyltransferase family protein n=1 Tax=Micromonospora sp. Llam0 TaxID=2485143 RepID=UPI000F47EA26|nr:formyltransferase family protein [Micromonospora sp. Llam0]ROO63077.1 formyl transferase-like protein [Micromonospora sp. Llam0]